MSLSRKTISVVAGCYNEEGNLQPFYDRLMKVFEQLPGYDYEIIVADNCSTDGSQEILRSLAAGDRKFKVILNANNYGQIRSPFHALLQATGDAVVAITSDLQNPPELIPEFVKKWEEGHEVVIAVKRKTAENAVVSMVRNFYYYLLSRFSESDHIIRGFTGFGLYDRKFMDALALYKNSYPYFRGLVGEIGFRRAMVLFDQPPRRQGRSKNNFWSSACSSSPPSSSSSSASWASTSAPSIPRCSRDRWSSRRSGSTLTDRKRANPPERMSRRGIACRLVFSQRTSGLP